MEEDITVEGEYFSLVRYRTYIEQIPGKTTLSYLVNCTFTTSVFLYFSLHDKIVNLRFL